MGSLRPPSTSAGTGAHTNERGQTSDRRMRHYVFLRGRSSSAASSALRWAEKRVVEGGGPFVSFPILSIYFIDFSCLLPSSWAYFTWPRNQMIRAGILRFTPNLICLPINSIAPLVLSDGEGEPFSA